MNNQFGESLTQDLNNDLLLEWAELYALDALPTEELTEIEAFVSEATPTTKDGFKARVAKARQTLSDVYGNFEAEPPTDLLGAIMKELPTTAKVQEKTENSTAQSAGISDLAQHREKRKKRFTPTQWILSAAAAVAVVIAGVTVAQNMQPNSLTDQIMTATDVQQRTLDVAGGSAEISVSESSDAAVVSMRDVPPPPEGKVYQLWRIPTDGTVPVPAGTMTGEDVATGKLTAVTDIDPYSALAITIEPEGGSETPTMPVIASIPLES
ncbi:anti-sigma factor [Arthrobacter roseus]|uniref:anti-sigma factor n=1 Tax=Arthrobacter roseus TaxID=136274 RepID=UPI001963C1E9|nr:anti-sigma factor [Arthrobacter roseus]MBM7849137.1 anti-sigma-K factor RskA [Arthrobacter roseus]